MVELQHIIIVFTEDDTNRVKTSIKAYSRITLIQTEINIDDTLVGQNKNKNKKHD